MEVEHPFASIFVTFILLFVFMVLRRGKFSKTPQKNLNLPPGPWKLPLIGNLHQLVGYNSLPHHGLRDLAKKYGPLMHLQAGEISTIVVSSPEAAKDVMQTHGGIFATRGHYQAAEIASYDYTSIFFAPYGDYWRQLKKMFVSEILSKKRVQFIQSIREEEMSNLINWIASKAGSQVNLTDNLHSSSYNITSKAACGRKSKNQVILMSLMKRVMILATRAYIADLFPSTKFLQCISVKRYQLERLHQEMDQILENIINEYKDKARSEFEKQEVDDEDLVDILLKVQEHGDSEFHLTNDNIKAVNIDVFFGSSDTSATTVDWAMSELMKNPRLMKKAQAEVRGVGGSRKGNKVDETDINEMKFLKLVIKETMRLHPPATLIPRECGEQCVINGFDIPIKAKVIVNIWALGRDPEYWTEPESFVPERFFDCPIDYKGTNFEYIPFGAGRRICPGIQLGVTNVEFLLASLLYHFDWKLPNGMQHEDMDMNEAMDSTVRRKNDLCLIPIPYHPSYGGFWKKCKDQQKFILYVRKASKLASGFSIADLYPSIGVLEVISGMKSKFQKLHQEQDRILGDIIDEHKERRQTTKTGQKETDEEDLVDVFLRLQQDGDLEFPLTNNNIKADIFAAGGETSSTTVEWAMSEMLKNPSLMKEAQAEVRRVFDVKGKVDESGIHELKFLKAVIIETLRLHPIAPLVPRENSDNCQINGYEIPAKTRTIVNAWAIGRDPKSWNEAEKFIPERFLDSPLDYKGTNFSYIPFGAGRRICPGIQFAIPNIELPLAQLLYHFDWKLPNGMKEEDLDMTEAFGVTVRRKNDLMLIPIPYRPCLDIK
ncbi:hypothetical protein Ddye_027739 [Dipteronia dyeriana]|uniref:Cytochrome P450 n=1 Tax=Dipteronia dyeriana TaxID=168575 RepID=A0AAD9WQG5_9ROSI|nr:hypothetical protein Ddye_027739 [Dipteronia dyeriana]